MEQSNIHQLLVATQGHVNIYFDLGPQEAILTINVKCTWLFLEVLIMISYAKKIITFCP